MNEHAHEHNVHPPNYCYKKRARIYFLIVLINIIIIIVQAYFAITEGSLSLLSDTIHCGGDAVNTLGLLTIEILFCFFGARLLIHENIIRKLFSYVQILLLFTGAVYIGYEAFFRFVNPPEIAGLLIAKITLAGLIGNILAHKLMHKIPDEAHTHNHSLLSIHILFDIALSCIVLVGNLCIHFSEEIIELFSFLDIEILTRHIFLIDPSLSSIVATFMIFLSIRMLYRVQYSKQHKH